MSSVQDSLIFGDILSTRESASIWSDVTRTAYYLQFEAALARVQAELGIIPQNAAVEIARHCKLERIDMNELRQQTELIGYPVLGVVQQLVKQVNAVEPRLGEWTHWGATTQVRIPFCRDRFLPGASRGPQMSAVESGQGDTQDAKGHV